MSFYTDVIVKDPRFNSPERIHDIRLLEPTTRALVQEILSAAREMGIEVTVFETYRSQARQKELFNLQATQLRRVGVHHYGLACDIVKVIGGEASWKGDFDFLGQLAHNAGLIWGATRAIQRLLTNSSTEYTFSVAQSAVSLNCLQEPGIQTRPITHIVTMSIYSLPPQHEDQWAQTEKGEKISIAVNFHNSEFCFVWHRM